ncbi:DNA (cytosine-5-)-methyltransferase [Streptococcus equi subsp. zooepidemicus]|uniref:DNA (cytosine-5-)-methyltransferase n=1 Tax=Streptococcus equi TaxID=1336 RepID=UPI0024A9F6AA|nr:DNA (cytosine-5-)-methyltransferase [Streptococcus equi]MDI6043904.1 DNA (cytosine-5-)-methyltransferase [Streptococcus equi subsp. zooepidemicus]
MKFLDLFAGIGGFRLGLTRQGHECIGFCEIDKFARKSYKAIYETEGEIEFHDIRQVTDQDFRQLRGQVDIICGGFPCQAFSLAGRRLGFEDTRGTLFFEIARAAKQVQPRFLFLENVKGLLSHDKGETFRTILTTLDELGDKFLRELMQSDLEVMVSLHAKGAAKSEAMTKLRTKKTLMESQKIGEQQKMARSGVYLEKVSQVLESNIDEADELIKTMTQTGDKLFDTLFLIGVFADNEDQLKHSLDIIKQVAGSNDLVIDNLTYMQEAGFNSLLPFGKNYLDGVSRSLLTSNIAVNSPWTSVDLQDKGGKFYGINQVSSNIITIDRGKLNTPSGLILGTSGAGKGMAKKHEIISTKLKEADSDTEIIIVDPENEVRQEVVL